MRELLILNYHEILPKSSAAYTTPAELFAISRERFQAQMDLIEKHPFPVISIDDFLSSASFEGKAIALTFDDGYESDVEIAAPILQKKGFPAAFFPIINQLGKEGFMDWGQIQDLHKQGFEIGTHGLSHRDISRLNFAEKKHEIEKAKELSEQYLNQEINLFSFPFGRYDKASLSLAQSCGFQAALGTRTRLNKQPQAFLLHRWNIKRALPLEQFEKIISFDRNTLNRKIFLGQIKTGVTSVLGASLSNQIHLLLAHLTQPK